ncbi:MAG TPA: helix-turn-helix transcriptional regulator [Actinomycetota bacterium]|nr:helix-turn-helix transcriptional regulator [Actinomycetota bacterium]
MADELDEQARAAFRRGDEAEAMKLVRQSWVARDAADEREQALSGLPRRVNKRTVNTVMTSAHKVAISAGRAPKNKLAAAARDAGLTMRDLAKRLGVSLALISMATRGERSIKRELALEIEKLTGYRVSNWRSLS